MRAITAIVLTNLLLISTAGAQPDVAAGQRTFAVCAGCHGFDGEGNQGVNAPRLAGVEAWYIKRQMQNFANGSRGHLDGDVHGQRMALMAQAVTSERSLEDLVAYISLLPADKNTPATVSGDAGRGQGTYALCAACHGPDGHGSEAVQSPSLTALDDWYVVEQLRLYAEGLRGTGAGDVYGQQMRALGSIFADDESRRNLAAYINSLER